MNPRSCLVAAGILGLTGVALGAFGAHGLRAVLMERGMSSAFETGVRYHLLHAVALIALAAWTQSALPSQIKCAGWAARCWAAGVIVFSGSLYALALGGPRWLGPVTPVGGVALLAGWALVVVAALKRG